MLVINNRIRRTLVHHYQVSSGIFQGDFELIITEGLRGIEIEDKNQIGSYVQLVFSDPLLWLKH